MKVTQAEQQLKALADHLERQRSRLLRAWREAIHRDPGLTTSSSIPRAALDDHIPKVLEAFENRLRAEHALDVSQVDAEQRISAAEHGSHRWQQGYDLRETIREWGHLQRTVLLELEQYAVRHPELDSHVMSMAREELARVCTEGTCESATRHVRLQQAEAASRVRDLQASFDALQALEDQRAALVREATHDLRGSVGVIANASALLAKPHIAEVERGHFYELLDNRIRAMSALLAELTDLARLEAGQDPAKIESFDAAECLKESCSGLRPIASQKNLFLKCDGPAPFTVEGDPVKLQRIIQNLMLNALKVTEQGGIQVRWSLSEPEAAKQWMLCVQDTGPGFDAGTAGPLRNALKSATDHAHDADGTDNHQDQPAGKRRARVLVSESDHSRSAPPAGEGIGLSIVKRLCEVLGATIELETGPGLGTTFRITFPLHYSRGSTG